MTDGGPGTPGDSDERRDERHQEDAEDEGAGVSTLELFFDLVFVFAITQITFLVGHDPTARGLGHAVLVFAMLWWAWGAYAWLTNTLPTGEMLPRLLVLVGMAAALVAALAVPESFAGDHGGTGTAFGLAYLVVMTVHLALYVSSAENPEVTRQAILRLAPTNALGAALLIAGGVAGDGADGSSVTQEVLWTAAVLASFLGPYLTGVAGFTVHPRHFAERHGLIVIVALGESVVAIGAGARGLPVDWALAGTSLLAVVLVTALWWAYFDGDAERTEQVMTTATGAARARIARDAYSFLHVPLVFGIVLTAVGLHEAVVHPGDSLDPVVGGAFGAGVALYFAGLTVKRLRCGARAGAGHVAAVLWAAAVAALAPHVDAFVTLALLAVPALAAAVSDAWTWSSGPPTVPARSEPRPDSA